MAETLAELTAKITADTKNFQSGIAGADKKMGGFASTVQKHHKAIGMAMVAMGAAVIAMGVKSVQAYTKMGDEVQKMALRTGFSTEALSELRHAAELSGASLASIETGVKKMARTISDANEGMLTYQRAFDRIGLSAEELINLKPEEQFERITMAIAELENETLQAATAQEIFGRSGTDLLPFLKQGPEGIAAMRQEAHDLSIVFDQEAANAAAKFTDDMLRMKKSMDGVKFTIAEAIMPVLNDLIIWVTDVIKKIREWADEHPELVERLTKLTLGIGAFLVVGGPLVIMLPQIAAGFHLLAGALTAVKAVALGPVGLAIAALVAAGYGVYKFMEYAATPAVQTRRAIAELNEELRINAQQLANAKKNYEDSGLDIFAQDIEKLSRKQIALQDARKELLVDTEALAAAEAALNEQFKKSTFEFELQTKEAKAAAKKDKEAAEAVRKLEIAYESLEDAQRAHFMWNRDITRGVENLIEQIKFNNTEAGKLGITTINLGQYILDTGGDMDKFAETMEKAEKTGKGLNWVMGEMGIEAKDVSDAFADMGDSADKSVRGLTKVFNKLGEIVGMANIVRAQKWEEIFPGAGYYQPGDYVEYPTAPPAIPGTPTVFPSLEKEWSATIGAHGIMDFLTWRKEVKGYATGGIIPGPIGAPQLAMVHGGERIIPANEGVGVTVNFTQPVFFDREDTMNRFVDMISKGIDRKQRLRFGGAYSG